MIDVSWLLFTVASLALITTPGQIICGPRHASVGLYHSRSECWPSLSPPPPIVIAGTPMDIAILESVLPSVRTLTSRPMPTAERRKAWTICALSGVLPAELRRSI